MNEPNALVQIEHISQIRGRKNQMFQKTGCRNCHARPVKRQLASAGLARLSMSGQPVRTID
jgi:hypothetical protein